MEKIQEVRDAEVGRISNGWQVVKLPFVFDVYGGTTPSTSKKEYWGGEMLWVTPTDITRTNGNISLDRTEKHVTDKAVNESSLKILPKGTLLLTSRATIGFTALNTKPVTINQGLTALLPKDKRKVSTLFYAYYFQRLKPYLEQLGSGSTFKEVSRSTIKNLKIPLPPLPEQKKIAEVLSAVDRAVGKAQEAIDKTERLKKGLMQELLTRGIGHKEFKDTKVGRIPMEWEVVQFEEVAEFKNGLNFKKEQKGTDGILTVDVLNMYGKGIYLNLDNLYRVNVPLKNASDYLLKKGDVLFVRSSLKKEGAGWAGLFDSWKEPIAFCGFIIRGRLEKNSILPKFLVYFLRGTAARSKLIASSGQVAITNITQETLKKLNIPIPPLVEQKKIAEILGTIDKRLALLRKKKNRLERVKKGLMQELLTGKRRVRI